MAEFRKTAGGRLRPNIKTGGRVARGGLGVLCTLAAAWLAATGIAAGDGARLLGAMALAGTGALAFFEVANCWCVVRALGVKTPL